MSDMTNGSIVAARPSPAFTDYRSYYQQYGVGLLKGYRVRSLLTSTLDPIVKRALVSLYLAESSWHQHQQPHIRVYSHYVSLLTNTTLKIPVDYCRMPLPAIAISCEHAYPFANALLSFMEVPSNILVLTVSASATANDGFVVTCNLEAGKTIQECLDRAVKVYHDDANCPDYLPALRIAVNCILLLGHARHEGIVHPIVLRDDIERYKQGTDADRERLVVKAKKRNRVGWTIGHPQLLPRRTAQQIVEDDALDKHARQRNHQYIRCGHWREQAYGHRWSKHKLLWLPPTICRPDLPLKDFQKTYSVK